jgi:hypothetical protein
MVDQDQPRAVPNPERNDALLAAYEFARENGTQADSMAWEMTAIIWGGQTLLLGFVLEAIGNSIAQPLIVLMCILGVFLALFNRATMRTRTFVARTMVETCRKIEVAVSMSIRPQEKLDSQYPAKRQSVWFDRVNYTFMVIWILVGLFTLGLLCWEFFDKIAQVAT